MLPFRHNDLHNRSRSRERTSERKEADRKVSFKKSMEKPPNLIFQKYLGENTIKKRATGYKAMP